MPRNIPIFRTRRNRTLSPFRADETILARKAARPDHSTPHLSPATKPRAPHALDKTARPKKKSHKALVLRAPAKILRSEKDLREREAIDIKNSLSLLKLFHNAPCGDLVELRGFEPLTF